MPQNQGNFLPLVLLFMLLSLIALGAFTSNSWLLTTSVSVFIYSSQKVMDSCLPQRKRLREKGEDPSDESS
jgi:hypothetical protein